VAAVNLSSMEIVAKIPTGLLPTSVAVSSDGSTAYVTNGYGFNLSEINIVKNTLILNVPSVGVYPAAVVLYH
jgi:DNA-binding beta-propeller fold protein YncE